MLKSIHGQYVDMVALNDDETERYHDETAVYEDSGLFVFVLVLVAVVHARVALLATSLRCFTFFRFFVPLRLTVLDIL
jgi:hypothetical protein